MERRGGRHRTLRCQGCWLGRAALPRQRGPEPANPGETRLIETERGDGADPIGMIRELIGDHDHRGHHRVPAATQIPCHIGDCSPIEADLHRRPAGCPRCQRAPGPADLAVLVAPAATAAWASPSLLAQHRPFRSTERRKTRTTPAYPVTMRRPTATGRSRRMWRSTSRSQVGHSPTPTMVTSGKPTNNAHIRVAPVSRQGLLEPR